MCVVNFFLNPPYLSCEKWLFKMGRGGGRIAAGKHCCS